MLSFLRARLGRSEPADDRRTQNAFAFAQLPHELGALILDHLVSDEAGVKALGSLRLASRQSAALVDEVFATRLARARVHGALTDGAFSGAAPHAQSLRVQFLESVKKSGRLDIEVPPLDGLELLVRRNGQWQDLRLPWFGDDVRGRLLNILQLVTPVLPELRHVAIRYRRPHLIASEAEINSPIVDLTPVIKYLLRLLLSNPHPKLETLVLHNEALTKGTWLNHLRDKTPRLRRLELSMRLVWSDVVQALPDGLRALELSNCNVDDAGLAQILPVLPPSLRYLGLGYSRLERAARLSEHTQLETVALTLAPEIHGTVGETQLSHLPPRLKHLALIDYPAPKLVRRALRLCSCKDSLQTLSFVTLPPRPKGCFTKEEFRKVNTLGGSVYALLNIKELTSIAEIHVPHEPPVTGCTCACASSNAYVMDLRHKKLKSLGERKLLVEALLPEKRREPTWHFVSRETGLRDIWPPERRATYNELKPVLLKELPIDQGG